MKIDKSWLQRVELVLGIVVALTVIVGWLVSQFVASSLTLGPRIASIALPAILLMEVTGAIIATFAIYRAGESSRPSEYEGVSNTSMGEVRG